MSLSRFTLGALSAGALLFGVPTAGAHEGHGHPGQDHAKEAPQAATTLGSQNAVASLRKHVDEMEKELAAGSLDGIHGHDEAIQAVVVELDKDSTLPAVKRKRVQGYVKNVIRVSGKLHAFADAKNLEHAKRDFGKLKAQVELLAKQFGPARNPAAEKPGQGEPASGKKGGHGKPVTGE